MKLNDNSSSFLMMKAQRNLYLFLLQAATIWNCFSGTKKGSIIWESLLPWTNSRNCKS